MNSDRGDRSIFGVGDFDNGSIQHVANELYDAAGMKRLEVPKSPFPVLSGTDRLYRQIPRLLDTIDGEGTAIIFARHTQIAGLGSREYESAICPLVHDFDEYLSGEGNWLRKRTLRHAISNLRRADRVLAISEATKQNVIRYANVPPARINVLKQGIDPERIHPDPAPPEGVSVPERYVLYAGALLERKRPDFLLDVLAELDPDLELVICGNHYNTGADEILLQTAQQRNLRERVHMMGYVSETNLRRLYTNAFVYFHAAESEGYGRTPIEAASCGTPVVLYSGIPAAEDLGSAGLTFDEFNPLEVASKIEKIAGQEVDHSPRTWDEVALDLDQIIESLVTE